MEIEHRDFEALKVEIKWLLSPRSNCLLSERVCAWVSWGLVNNNLPLQINYLK